MGQQCIRGSNPFLHGRLLRIRALQHQRLLPHLYTWANLSGTPSSHAALPHHTILHGPPQPTPNSTTCGPANPPEHLFDQPSDRQPHWTSTPTPPTPTFPPSTSPSMPRSASAPVTSPLTTPMTTPLTMPSPTGPTTLQVSSQQLFSGFSPSATPPQTFPLSTFTHTITPIETPQSLPQQVPHQATTPPTPRSTLQARTPRQPSSACTSRQSCPKKNGKIADPPHPDPVQEDLDRGQKDFDKLDSQAKELTDTILKIQQQQQRLLNSALLQSNPPDPILYRFPHLLYLLNRPWLWHPLTLPLQPFQPSPNPNHLSHLRRNGIHRDLAENPPDP